MASVRAWTALFKGYFDTTVRYKITDSHGEVRNADAWPLARVREALTSLFADQYGAIEGYPEAVEALAAYRPTFELPGPRETTILWYWGQHTDQLLCRTLTVDP